MNNSVRLWTWYSPLIAAGLVLDCVAVCPAQADPAPSRSLAPGVMKTIVPEPLVSESFDRHPIVELLAVKPNLKMARETTFRRDIWHLDFKFKPVRFIWIDVPQSSGRMQRKLIWYMVYSATNNGGALHPVRDANGTYTTETIDKPIRFIPAFLLESPEFNKAYPDRVIPLALPAIGRREDAARESRGEFLNSVTMAKDEIQVGQTVWGIATWESIDARIDRFAIYVTGLTNAYRWSDEPGAYTPGAGIGTGRRLSREILKLNFWRPGDEFDQNEKEIRYGTPKEVDYEWLYR